MGQRVKDLKGSKTSGVGSCLTSAPTNPWQPLHPQHTLRCLFPQYFSIWLVDTLERQVWLHENSHLTVYMWIFCPTGQGKEIGNCLCDCRSQDDGQQSRGLGMGLQRWGVFSQSEEALAVVTVQDRGPWIWQPSSQPWLHATTLSGQEELGFLGQRYAENDPRPPSDLVSCVSLSPEPRF